jgi:hypothetical protein
MQDRESTIRSRELGEGLREAMARADLDGRQAARKLGWSESRVSRMLGGKRGGKELEVVAFLAVCGVTGGERERLLELAREVDLRGWLIRHGERLPTQLRTLVRQEDQAVEVEDFQGTLVPGLLQTEEYARAVMEDAGTVPTGEIEERVTARMTRQSLFTRARPATFTFFVHENVLRFCVRSSEVMSGQLHHLLQMSVRPYIALRVIECSAGVHAAINGPFKLVQTSERKSVVYVETETSSLFLEEAVEIAAYRRILAALADTALDETQSRELIATLATELYADGERRDEGGRVGSYLA